MTLGRLRLSTVVIGKAVNITCSECVFVALGIQRAMRMRLITLSSVECPALRYFSISNRKRYDLMWKYLLNTKCVLLFSLQILSEIFLILRRIQRDIITNVHRSSCKVQVILVIF